jgi:hypothetical protein
MSTLAEPVSVSSEKPQDPVQENRQNLAGTPSDLSRPPEDPFEDEESYPHGVTVVLIMISLILAVLTVALVSPENHFDYFIRSEITKT